ncbi:heme biosynthesis protein HemY [Acinetobacter sp. 194]|uniref:heme biosynthesis protein HemY n=1 Tax=Acinetobacter shaoyimingii TaxID=2715164 RepID=UPI0014094B54|nr:heme biosynthesis protein HemY [Acinetobacter shaoyimingii]NHB59167.1 heme biosynthesis protein HemY [Acinetobacter shaoyimingii]
MKKILMAYGLLFLVIFAILSILSFGSGSGYVYVLWRGIQIQTNVWLVAFVIIFISFILQSSFVLIKRAINQNKRKQYELVSFNELHTYEQLGVAWLLEGEALKKDIIQPVFESSVLLKNIIQARILFKQEQFAEAMDELQKSPASVFELAEIQRVEIYLAQNDPHQALTHLEFLSGHILSPWLEPLRDLYDQRIEKLWGKLATQYPWLYLKATEYGHLNEKAKQKWLSQLLSQFDSATIEDIQLLSEKYLQQLEQMDHLEFETKLLWLKVLARMPEMAEQQGILSLNLLNERFDQDVFYLWFQQQLLKQLPDYYEVEKQINRLEEKYPSMPIFSFTKWHIYQATQREHEAAELLTLYPDHALMNYLRIKSTLMGDEERIQQLNTVFEKNMNFIPVKI